MSKFTSALLIASSLLLSSALLRADTPPVLKINDNNNNVIMIDDSGAVVFSGSCTPTTCVTTSISTAPGSIVWGGKIGSFTLAFSVGTSKEPGAPAPLLDLSIQHLSTTAGGTVTFQWTDINFNVPSVIGGQLLANGTMNGSGSSTYSAYFDDTNAEFGTGTPLGAPVTVTGTSITSINKTVNGPGPTANPFSMTEVATFALNPNALVSVDVLFQALPAPLTLKCGSATGIVGAPYSSALMAGGGVPPYSYSISTGTLPNGLTLNPTTGAITGTPTAPGLFSFTGQVSDSSGGSADTATASSACLINVTSPPPIALSCSAATGEVGVPYNSGFSVTGGIPGYTFSIISGNLPDGLTLDTTTGAITGTPKTAGSFPFVVQVKDSTGLSAGTTTSNCGIVINLGPSLTCSTTSGGGQVGVPYDSGAMSVTGGTPGYTFFIASGTLPAGLTLNPATGEVTGTPTAAGSFSIGVKDSNGQIATGNCPITIVAPLVLTCSTTSGGGEVGAPYDSGAMSVTGGTPGYTFFVSSGTLPAGLTLNPANGEVTGTPTAGGSFSIGVKDSNGQIATGNCPITIAGPPVLTCSTTSGGGEVGVPYDSGAMSVTGGTPGYTFFVSSGTLPAGLTLNPANGQVTGTPTAAGSFSIGVKDSKGQIASGNCPITIVGPPVLTCSTTSGGGEVGVPYDSGAMSVTGGTPGYTFFVSSGTLPAGLTLNPATGEVTGTPTAAGSFSIGVKDSNGQIASGNCPITIVGPPVLTCSTTSGGGEVGVPYDSGAMSVTGGTPGYTFFVSSGTLPAGLTLNPSTGEVTGTPTAAGSFSIGVKDSKGQIATGNCPITIAGPPVLTCSTTSSGGEVGVPYDSGTMSVTGGTPGYTFFVSSGTLPAGLTLNPANGEVTGTPTAAGSFSIGVKDSKGQIATGNCPITIAGPPVLTCSTTSAGGEVNVPYDSGPMSVTGGTPGYTFFVSSGTLPAGLTLNPATGEVTGTPTAAGSFSIGVKDSNGQIASGNCPIVIAGPPVLTCSTTSSGGEVNVPYDSGPMSVTGGTPGYTFFVSSGTLPAGLTLNPANGEVTGTPTAGGSFSIGVKDSKGQIASGNCPIVIAGPPVLTCSTTSSGGEINVPYDSGPMSVTGGTPGYTFFVSSGTLPAGLTLNPSTGEVTGTPSAAGSFSIGVKDSKGQIATGNCPIVIAGPPVLTCSTTSSGGEINVPYDSGPMSVTGGTPGYTFFVSSGTLPAGLTLNPSTGEVTGTPTAAGSFSIGVKDSKGQIATGNCPIVIAGPPVLTCSTTSAGGEVNVPYDSGPMSVSGGTPGYTFFVSGGTLPSGLTLNPSTGEVTGTPSAAGSFSIGVKDSKGQIATGNCPIVIAGPPVLTCSTTSAGGEVNVPYNSGTMTVTGGTPGYTFFIASGTLPAGLTLNTTTGAVTGTPTAAGSFSIGVKDSKGAIATGNCPIVIAGPPVLTCSATNAGVVGSAFNSGPMSVSGGTPGYTFFIASGTLPAGLTLNTTTGAVTGTPMAAGTFTIGVKDSKGVIATGTCAISITSPLDVCGLTWGYWKNHPWPTTSLVLGSQTYTQTELSNLLNSPVAGDASINLAHQLIAAKFNVLNGTPQSTDGGAISAADTLLSGFTGKLPYNVDPNSTIGQQMTTDAGKLDYFNSDGIAQPGCTNGPAPLTLACAAKTGSVNSPYSSSFVVSGGLAPYTFSVIGGALPPGLTLNTSTGALTGTPTTVGIYNFTIEVADATATAGSTTGTVQLNCSITIQPSTPTLTVKCPLGTATVGTSYSSAAVASGGSGSYTYALYNSILPPGLTLNATTGAITGKPTTSGTYSFLIYATDSKGAYGYSTCTIVVTGAIATGQFTTYTQGGWGAPNGNSPGVFLESKFTTVYTGGSVSIGGTYKLTFKSGLAIVNFLPAGGTAGKLTANATNPMSSAAGVFAGQVLALQLNVDFSNKGLLATGLASLKVVSGPLAGQTVQQVLTLANSVLGGAAPPSGMTISDLNNVVDAINSNFDSGSKNNGYLSH